MASKQSGRDIIPKVENIIDVKSLCEELSKFDLSLLAYENENEKSLKEALQKIKGTKDKLKLAIIIGPEGRNRWRRSKKTDFFRSKISKSWKKNFKN